MARRLPAYRPGVRMVRLSGEALLWVGFVLTCLGSVSAAVLQRGILKLDGEGALEALSEAMKPGGGAMVWATWAVLCALSATLAVPIYAKLVLEAGKNGADTKKLLGGLAVCALASEIPYDFAMNGRLLDMSAQNPAWGLLLAAVMLEILRRWKLGTAVWDGLFKALVVLAAVAWTLLLRVYAGPIAVLLAALFHFAAKRKAVAMLGSIAVTLPQFPAPLGLLFVHWYDEEKPWGSGRLFLALYPVQLTAFGLLGMLLQ